MEVLGAIESSALCQEMRLSAPSPLCASRVGHGRWPVGQTVTRPYSAGGVPPFSSSPIPSMPSVPLMLDVPF